MICARCNKETNTFIMSIFNEDMLCLCCKDKEKIHPRYNEAVQREHEELVKGNYNYPGLAIEEGFDI